MNSITMKTFLTTLVLALSCTLAFGKSKDKVKVYTNDDGKRVVSHAEMECFDDMSDEAYVMWVEDEGFKLVLRLKKETVTGTKSIDIFLKDGTVIKAKAVAADAEKTYNPWVGWVYVTDMAVTLDEQALNACLEGNVEHFDLYNKGRGEEPYVWERKKGKWNFDKNFKEMYEAVNAKK